MVMLRVEGSPSVGCIRGSRILTITNSRQRCMAMRSFGLLMLMLLLVGGECISFNFHLRQNDMQCFSDILGTKEATQRAQAVSR